MSEAAGSLIWAEQEQERCTALSPHPYRSNLWLLTTPKLPKNAVIVTCYLLLCGHGEHGEHIANWPPHLRPGCSNLVHYNLIHLG